MTLATDNLPVKRATVLGSLAEKYSMDPNKLLETISKTCIKGNATPEQVQAFLIVANRYGLDPFLKQIHAFAGQGGGIVPIVGIDGWAKVANDTGLMDGCSFEFSGSNGDLACTCTLHVKNRARPTVITEYLAECKRNTPPWNTMPRRMLRHKAYMQCVRVAFGLGGIFDEDEARDVIDNGGGGGGRLEALNAAVAPQKTIVSHPTAENQVIDPTDASEPEWTEPEMEVPGEVLPPKPKSDTPDLSNIDVFYEVMQTLAADAATPPSVFEKMMNDMKNPLNSAIMSGPMARQLSARVQLWKAAKSGKLEWSTGKILG